MPFLPRGFAPALLSVAVGLALLAPPAPAAEQRLSFSGHDQLGISVDVDGDTLVLGAPGDADATGAVYVFQRTGDAWSQTAKLTASDGAPADLLGRSVAIDGDTIVAGAPDHKVGANADQGSLYTFARTGAPTRTETAKLAATDGATGSQFGQAVAIDGNTIVAGAPFDDVGTPAVDRGSAYTFTRAGRQTSKLTASAGVAGSGFGSSVAVDGDTIVVGAPFDTVGDNARQGSAYTFPATGAPARTQAARITASNGLPDAALGFSVAIQGDTIVAGAPTETIGGSERGAVFTFPRTGAGPGSETARLTTTDGALNDFMGASVAIDGDTIVAGAFGDDVGENAEQGSAYTFTRTGDPTRRQSGKLVEADGAATDIFGGSVAIDGATLVVGAPLRGSATVFFAPAPAPPTVSPPADSSAPPPPPPPPPPPAKPVLSKLALTPKTVRRGAKSAKRTSISFRLSSVASVELRFAKALPGRISGRKCAKPSRSNLHGRRCNRYVPVGSFAVPGKLGSNRVAFAGERLRRKPLSPGSYKLTAAPNGGAARATTFKIVGR